MMRSVRLALILAFAECTCAFYSPILLPGSSRAAARAPPPAARLRAVTSGISSRLCVDNMRLAGQFLESDDVNICCIRRPIPDALSAAWSCDPKEASASVDYLASPAASLEPILALVADESSQGLALKELTTLGSFFQKLLNCRAVETRIEIMVSKTRCQLYHTDKVPMRLSVSLLGPGTEYLPEEDLQRYAMLPWKRRGKTIDEINEMMVRPSKKAKIASPGEILLIKGESFGSSAAAPRSLIVPFLAAALCSPPKRMVSANVF